MFVFTLIPVCLYLLFLLILKGPLSPLTAILLCGGALYLFKFRKNRTALFLFLVISLLAGGGRILLIPGSVYQAWYQLLSIGQPEGTVSSVFAMTAGILSFPGYLKILEKPRGKGLLYLFLSQSMILVLIYPGFRSFMLLILLTSLLFHQNIPPGERGIWLSGWIPLFFAVSALFSLLSPSREEIKGSEVISSVSNTLREKVLTVFPDYPLFFNLPGYGTGYRETNRGGRPVLTPAALFRIEGYPGESIYLKTETFQVFSGKIWISDPAEQVIKIPRDEVQKKIRNRTLTVLTEYSRRIPYTEKTGGLTIAGEQYSIGHPWETPLELPLSLPLKEGTVINLHESGNSFPEPPSEEDFTALPEITRSEFRFLAETFYTDDPIETVRLIRNYLIREYTYSLETEATEFPLSHFLNQSRKGYCVHFSSAFAVLARLNGIPVRLAGGYRIRIPEESREVRRKKAERLVNITGYASHRWPEVYLPDRGWVIVEVTPPFTDENEKIMDTDDEQTRSLLAEQGVPVPADTRVPDSRTTGTGVGIVLQILIPALFLTLLSGIGIYRLKTRLVRRVRKSVNHYRLFRIPSPSETGWVAWVDGVSARSRYISTVREELQNALLSFEYNPNGSIEEKLIVMKILKEDRSSWIRPAPIYQDP